MSNKTPKPYKWTGRRHLTVRKNLLAWYATYGRDFPWRSPKAGTYEKIVCEVLLQQTTAAAVRRIYPLFFARFPSWEKLSEAKIPRIAEVIHPLGIWKKRARSLSALAREVVIRNGEFPSNREDLESIPAVGQYVASAILLFVHGKAEPLLDVNMARVLERYFGTREHADIRTDSFIQKAARMCLDKDEPCKSNWSFLDLGATTCTARNPNCGACPLRHGCNTLRN